MISPKSARGPRVLVIDDDLLVRAILFDIVNEVGFDVLEAESASEAMELLDEFSNIRLVISDICMPGGMTGFELAQTISLRWPGIEIVLTSGQAHIDKAKLPPRTAFVAKPFDRAALIKALGQIEAGTRDA